MAFVEEEASEEAEVVVDHQEMVKCKAACQEAHKVKCELT